MIIYIVSDGKRGHINQTQGLAEALLQRAREAQPLGEHAYHLVDVSKRSFFTRLFYKGNDLKLPPPNLILCAGHGTHLAALGLRRRYKCLLMVCMKPSLPLGLFDLCITPKHDFIAKKKVSPHVFLTDGALNSIYARPDVAKKNTLILIGGPSKSFRWDAELLLRQISTIARHSVRNMVLTTSRRTPKDFVNDMRRYCPSVRVEPFEETHPRWVADQLASAYDVWVTEDDVSMIYEGLSSGTPLGLLDMQQRGKGSQRIVRGLKNLIAENRVSTFTNWAKTHELPQGAPFNEASRVADFIMEKFSSKLLS